MSVRVLCAEQAAGCLAARTSHSPSSGSIALIAALLKHPVVKHKDWNIERGEKGIIILVRLSYGRFSNSDYIYVGNPSL
jgi:hypothetical protein